MSRKGPRLNPTGLPLHGGEVYVYEEHFLENITKRVRKVVIKPKFFVQLVSDGSSIDLTGFDLDPAELDALQVDLTTTTYTGYEVPDAGYGDMDLVVDPQRFVATEEEQVEETPALTVELSERRMSLDEPGPGTPVTVGDIADLTLIEEGDVFSG